MWKVYLNNALYTPFVMWRILDTFLHFNSKYDYRSEMVLCGLHAKLQKNHKNNARPTVNSLYRPNIQKQGWTGLYAEIQKCGCHILQALLIKRPWNAMWCLYLQMRFSL